MMASGADWVAADQMSYVAGSSISYKTFSEKLQPGSFRLVTFSEPFNLAASDW